MAKKNISARVPPRVADSIDEYAEAWEMNRTDAITAILETVVEGLPEPEQMEGTGESEPMKYAYTLEMTPENAEYIEEADSEAADALNSLADAYRR